MIVEIVAWLVVIGIVVGLGALVWLGVQVFRDLKRD